MYKFWGCRVFGNSIHSETQVRKVNLDFFEPSEVGVIARLFRSGLAASAVGPGGLAVT